MVQLTQRPMRARLVYGVEQQIAHGTSPEVIVLTLLAALREPTEAMIQAGVDTWDEPASTTADLWRAMIDAAAAD